MISSSNISSLVTPSVAITIFHLAYIFFKPSGEFESVLIVGSVVADMARILSIRYSERQNRQFKLLRQTLVTINPNSEEEEVSYLSLDQNTGEITTSQILDREKLCDKAETCIIRLKVGFL